MSEWPLPPLYAEMTRAQNATNTTNDSTEVEPEGDLETVKGFQCFGQVSFYVLSLSDEAICAISIQCWSD
jgi:hypothetical protein